MVMLGTTSKGAARAAARQEIGASVARLFGGLAWLSVEQGADGAYCMSQARFFLINAANEALIPGTVTP